MPATMYAKRYAARREARQAAEYAQGASDRQLRLFAAGRLCHACLERVTISGRELCSACASTHTTRIERRRKKLSPNRRTHRPPTPTQHPPGSAGKLEVLRQRLEQDFDLFHPKDAGMDVVCAGFEVSWLESHFAFTPAPVEPVEPELPDVQPAQVVNQAALDAALAEGEQRQRIEWLLAEVWQGNQSKMARDLAVPYQTLATYFRTKDRSPTVLQALLRWPGLSREWLLTGTGKALVEVPAATVEPAAASAEKLRQRMLHVLDLLWQHNRPAIKRATGVPSCSLSLFYAGVKVRVGRRLLHALCRVPTINAAWLLTGEGEPMK